MQPLAHSVLMLIQPIYMLNDSIASDAWCGEINLVQTESAQVYSKKTENSTFFIIRFDFIWNIEVCNTYQVIACSKGQAIDCGFRKKFV